jgi:hypothetical protein
MTNLEKSNKDYLAQLQVVKAAILEGRAFFKGFRVIRFNDWKGSALVAGNNTVKWVHKAFPVALHHIEVR